MRRRQKTALVLFLLCMPGRVFFSEQQVASESTWPPDNSPTPHPPSSDVVTSQILLNPLFIAHLLTWIILLPLFVVALVDIMLKAVFYTCAVGVHLFSLSQHRQRSRSSITDCIRHTTIDVYIQGATDLPLCVRISRKSHGSVLYRIMKDLFNIPVELQLLYAGKAVKHGSKLTSQGIMHGSTVFFCVKGIGGGGNDNNVVVLNECVSCGEHATYYCKECEAARCQICNEMWHKHKSRRNHSVEVMTDNADVTEMETSSGSPGKDSDSKNDSFTLSGEDEFDSIVGTIDVNEVTKTYLLAEKFGNTRFKDFQKESIDAVLNKKNCLVIQPTGKGKNLCYQFPAVYTGNTTLVITPTISLMHDQTRIGYSPCQLLINIYTPYVCKHSSSLYTILLWEDTINCFT